MLIINSAPTAGKARPYIPNKWLKRKMKGISKNAFLKKEKTKATFPIPKDWEIPTVTKSILQSQ